MVRAPGLRPTEQHLQTSACATSNCTVARLSSSTMVKALTIASLGLLALVVNAQPKGGREAPAEGGADCAADGSDASYKETIDGETRTVTRGGWCVSDMP